MLKPNATHDNMSKTPLSRNTSNVALTLERRKSRTKLKKTNMMGAWLQTLVLEKHFSNRVKRFCNGDPEPSPLGGLPALVILISRRLI